MNMIDAEKKSSRGLFSSPIQRREAIDTGMAMVLLCLIVWFVTGDTRWTVAAVSLLLINMTWPSAFKPVAKVWLGLSHVLGAVMSRVILSLIFFVVVTPLALLRRMIGHDPMARRHWKTGSESLFIVRDHTYSAEDIERPF